MGQRGFRFSSEVKTNYIVIVAFIVLALLAVYIVYGNPNRSSFGASSYKAKIINKSSKPVRVRLNKSYIKAPNWSAYIRPNGSTVDFTCTESDTLEIYFDNSNNNFQRKQIKIDQWWSRTEVNLITWDGTKETVSSPPPPPPPPDIYIAQVYNKSSSTILVSLNGVYIKKGGENVTGITQGDSTEVFQITYNDTLRIHQNDGKVRETIKVNFQWSLGALNWIPWNGTSASLALLYG